MNQHSSLPPPPGRQAWPASTPSPLPTSAAPMSFLSRGHQGLQEEGGKAPGTWQMISGACLEAPLCHLLVKPGGTHYFTCLASVCSSV